MWRAGLIGAALFLGLACRGKEPAPPAAQTPAAGAPALSAFELENGIGPVTSPVTLGALDQTKAAAGKTIFEQKCSACHKMGEKYVGPALGNILDRRTPAYVMNMMLNPQEMVDRHPVAKQLLAEHLTFMPNQGLTPDQAREVVEYLRTQ